MASRKPAEPQDDAAVDDNENGWRSRVVSRSLARAKERSLERGRHFVDAAVALLSESGSTGFTVQEVCDRAQQSLRTFYQHFGGKDDLLLAVYEELFNALVERVKADLEGVTDPVERIAVGVSSMISQTIQGVVTQERRDRALVRFRLVLAEDHATDVAVVQAPYAELLRRLIADAMEVKAIPAGDPEKLAFILTSLKTAYLHSSIMGNDVGLEPPSVDELVQFCMKGLGAEWKPGKSGR